MNNETKALICVLLIFVVAIVFVVLYIATLSLPGNPWGSAPGGFG